MVGVSVVVDTSVVAADSSVADVGVSAAVESSVVAVDESVVCVETEIDVLFVSESDVVAEDVEDPVVGVLVESVDDSTDAGDVISRTEKVYVNIFRAPHNSFRNRKRE